MYVRKLIEIEPKQLHFPGPYTGFGFSSVEIMPKNGLILDVVEVELRLHNATDQRLAFKVKTTRPSQYCVRPNMGFLQPEKDANVTGAFLIQILTF
mgnify:CR=1 FL=1